MSIDGLKVVLLFG